MEKTENNTTQGTTLATHPDQYITRDISTEAWRSYEWVNIFGQTQIVVIKNPIKLITRKGGDTHRVVDAQGVTTCVPAPEVCGGVLRWHGLDGGWM